jgi:hypothetical protein
MDVVICPFCGREVAADQSLCPFCGCRVAAPAAPDAPLPDPNESLPAVSPEHLPVPVLALPEASEASKSPEAPETSGEPEASTASAQPAGPKYAPVSSEMPDGGLSTAQYFWTMILFAIPLIGLGFMLYWSFGSTTSPARRRLARACLIKTGLFSVIAALVVTLAVGWAVAMGARLLDAVEDYLYDSYYEDYEDDYGYGDSYGDGYGYGYGYGPYAGYYGGYGYSVPYGSYGGSFGSYNAPSGYTS